MITLESLWGYFGMLCFDFGIILKSLWNHFWDIMGSLLDLFGIILGDLFGSFWGHSNQHPNRAQAYV